MDVIDHGIDLTACDRIAELLDRHGERFLLRVFTVQERAYSDSHHNRVERYAARFAVKEAVMKALGTGWANGVKWTDIEVTNHPGGRPDIQLAGRAASLAAQLGIKRFSISITHTAGQAMASAIALGHVTEDVPAMPPAVTEVTTTQTTPQPESPTHQP